MGNTETTPKFKESSILGDSNKGFSSEAPQIGAAGRSPFGSGCGESSALRDSDKGYLSEAPQMGAVERSPVERQSPVRGTPARTLWRAPVMGNSGAWGVRRKGATRQDSCLRGWVRLPFSGGNTYLLAIYTQKILRCWQRSSAPLDRGRLKWTW